MNIPPIYPQWYDYRKYKTKINKFFRSEMRNFEGISGLNIALPRELFWDIVEGAEVNKNAIAVKIAKYLTYTINIKILADEKIISSEVELLSTSWFKYLHNNFFKDFNLTKSIDVIEKLMNSTPISSDQLSLYKIYLSHDPKKIKELISPQADFMEFWREFNNLLSVLYNIFEKISLYLGNEHGKITGNTYSRIQDVYQLCRGNGRLGPRTPKGYGFDLNKFLNLLICVKNGIVSHGNIIFIPFEEPEFVEVFNVNLRQVKTSCGKFSREDLYNIIYYINFLLRGFESIALYYHILIDLVKTDLKYRTLLKCPRCGGISLHVFTPNKKFVKCKNCRKKIHR